MLTIHTYNRKRNSSCKGGGEPNKEGNNNVKEEQTTKGCVVSLSFHRTFFKVVVRHAHINSIIQAYNLF